MRPGAQALLAALLAIPAAAQADLTARIDKALDRARPVLRGLVLPSPGVV